jgi:hypothetical protein
MCEAKVLPYRVYVAQGRSFDDLVAPFALDQALSLTGAGKCTVAADTEAVRASHRRF